MIVWAAVMAFVILVGGFALTRFHARPAPADHAVAAADLSPAAWRAQPLSTRLAFFEGRVAAFTASSPANNETQQQWDEDKARDLDECVSTVIDQSDVSEATVRPYINTCLAQSGMPTI